MTLPGGIALRENNTILVESVFHGAKNFVEIDLLNILSVNS